MSLLGTLYILHSISEVHMYFTLKILEDNEFMKDMIGKAM